MRNLNGDKMHERDKIFIQMMKLINLWEFPED